MLIITLKRWPNTPGPPLYLVYRDGQQTPFVVRRIPGGYAIDTFAFSYGTKPWFPTLRQCRERLEARWPPFTPAILNTGDWNPWT